MAKINLPSDLAKEIAKSLGMTEKWVDEWFEIDENKEGYFIAKLKPKKFLERDQFRTVCALTRDLGGEGYLQGAKAWAVPGPLAKKPLPQAPEDVHVEGTPQSPSGVKPPEVPNLKFIPVDAIKIPSFLPTRELISHERLSEIRESIMKHGLRYPIKVRRFNTDYELIDGYLRLKSVQQLGWKGILAEVKDATDKEVLVESFIVNKNRIEEDPITAAKKFDKLINVFGDTQGKVAEELGVTREYVANATRFLKLPKYIQDNMALNRIGFRHGLTLLTVNNVDLQLKFAREIIDERLTISQLEQRINELQPKPIAPTPPEIGEAPSPAGPAGFEPTNQAPTQSEAEAKALAKAYRESEDSALQREAETEPKIPPPQPFSQATECSESSCHIKTWFGHRLKDGRILCSLCFTRMVKEGEVSVDDLLPEGEAGPIEVRRKFKIIISLDPPLVFIDNWAKEPSKDQVLELLADDICERKYVANFHVFVEEVKEEVKEA